MKSIMFRCECGIATIHGECILSQIVGADREEINFRSEHIRHQCSGRNFDHDTNLHGGHLQFLAQLFNDGTRLSQFLDVAHHREHDLQIPGRCSAQNGAQLLTE
jgi:hypothetical protein